MATGAFEHGSFQSTATWSRPPHPRSTFVGRLLDQEALRTIVLRPSVRLVTLTGPSGVGKSRLAVRLADLLEDKYGDAIWFVSLATVSDPERVLPTIARALDARDDSSIPL